jgi:hypothetical protein
VYFVSRALPAGSGAVPNGRSQNVFVSTRGDDGWSTVDLTPFSEVGNEWLVSGAHLTARALVYTAVSLSPADQDNPTNNEGNTTGVGFDLYLTEGNERPTLVSQGAQPRTLLADEGEIKPPFVFNRELTAVGFVSTAPLELAANQPDASAGSENCYTWADVGQRLAYITNPATASTDSETCNLLGLAPDGRAVFEDRGAGEDAGRVFLSGAPGFSFPSGSNGNAPVQLSGQTPGAATFDGLSPNGTTAYITTSDHLVGSNTNPGRDIFAVAVSSAPSGLASAPPESSVRCVSCGDDTGNVVFDGQSADGSHVFFSSEEGLWSWDSATGEQTQLTTATDVRQLVFSSNGLYCAGLTSQLAGNPNGTEDIFRFSADSPPALITSGDTNDTYALTEAASGSASVSGGISDSGERVAYERQPASGGRTVVDEWTKGHTSQISPVGSAESSIVIGTAGPELEDVLLLAHDALVAQDENAGTQDIYDARADGGFPPPGATNTVGRTPNPVAPAISGYQSNLTPPGTELARLGANTARAIAQAKLTTPTQKLFKALKHCETNRSKRKRTRCEEQARRRYGPAPKVKKSLSRKGAYR